jgi:protein SCO1/2
MCAMALQGTPVSAATQTPAATLAIPDATLTNQFGSPVKLRDFTAHRVVAINFIFTSCQTICLPMGAHFGKLQQLLSSQGRQDVALLSITVDPVNDTPERLKRWAAQFGGGPMWTLLTGPKATVDQVLKELGGFSPDKLQHSSLLLVGRAGTTQFERTNALLDPEKIASVIAKYPAQVASVSPASTPPPATSPAGKYFTDVVLTDQDGAPRKLYSDLIKGKTVVINAFFTTCKDSCPIMAGNFALLQSALADRLGKDLIMLSISVDSRNDTPAVLKEYAGRYKARSGWYFLSGSPDNVDFALHRLGLYPDEGLKEKHLNLFLIGNDRTGLWKKAIGNADGNQILRVVQTVLNDHV